MAYDVIILPGAEMDIDEAILWYESQQKGLGIKFYSFILDKLEELKFNPQYYFNLEDGFRPILRLIHSPIILFTKYLNPKW